MIQWVYERTKSVEKVQEVYVTTDDKKIKECVELFGWKCSMTLSTHENGYIIGKHMFFNRSRYARTNTTSGEIDNTRQVKMHYI